MKKLVLASAVVLCLLFISLAACAQEDYVKTLKYGVNGYYGATDTFIDSEDPTYAYGSQWYMHLYMYNDNPRRSDLLKFDLTGQLPGNAMITSATLNLWMYQVVDMGAGDYVYAAPFRVGQYRDWAETQATWNIFKGSTYWGTPGCEYIPSDRSGTPDCSPLYFDRNSQINRYYGWNVTSSVQAWYGGATNNGWLMRITSHDGVAGEGISFNAKESAEAYRPYLTINYTVIPEPGSLLALLAGLGGLTAFYRRKR